MNMDKCEEIDFTSFPKYERSSDMNPIWIWSSNARSGLLIVINAKNKSFEDAIVSQQQYVKKIDISPKIKINIRRFDSNCVGNERSSVLVFTDRTFGQGSFRESENSTIAFEDSFNVTYAPYSQTSMKGCGCEDYFGEKRKTRSRTPPRIMRGKYIRRNNKLYFVEKLFKSNGEDFTEKEYAITEGDRCNFFVYDLLDKNIEIGIYENININKNTIQYMNVCQNPIVNILEAN